VEGQQQQQWHVEGQQQQQQQQQWHVEGQQLRVHLGLILGFRAWEDE
jgi:hypothetical protein